MAILKSLIMRNSRKKIGGIVTYGLKGQTVGREQAAKVTNRRTTAQMSQRVRLANLVQLWKRMSFWAKKGAFQTKLQKESDYNAFVKANIKGTAAYLTKGQVEAGSCVLAPVVIAKGSLNPVATTYNQDNDSFDSDIVVSLDNYTGTTLGDLARAIIANNNGIYNGDQISVIVALQQSTNDNPYVIVRAYEYTLDVDDTTPYTGSAIEQWLSIETDTISGHSVLVHGAETSTMAGAFVLSRTVNGALQVSNARLVLTSTAETFLATFTSATALNNAIKSYGTQQTDFLIPGDGGTVNPNSGGSTPVPVALTLNSVQFAGQTLTAGANISQPSQPYGSTVIFNFNKTFPYTDDDITLIEIGKGEDHVELEDITINGSAVSTSIPQNQIDAIMANYNAIDYFRFDVEGEGWRLYVNGSSADPGDVTP